MSDPGLVVMPTGTGKTETMLSIMVACQVPHLLVLVPTDALRTQLVSKFQDLGVLQQLGVVAASAMRPVVTSIDSGLTDVSAAEEIARSSNVVVATPASLEASTSEARHALLSAMTHLFVDEAHHAPASTWASVISAFVDRPVLLFTATPYRRDGQLLPGRPIYQFPLREAQKDGYYRSIDYKAVVSLADPDRAVAEAALERLRSDIAAGFDHLLMARVASIPRIETVVELYREFAPELGAVAVHSQLGKRRQREAFDAVATRAARIIVCVDMLGEGFDLPNLKVAALHDPKKSLSPLIQLVGRFTRSAEHLGDAALIVHRDPKAATSPLRELMREDADWNLLLRDISEALTSEAEEEAGFEASFRGGPEDVPLISLAPKMSAVCYRAPTHSWEPGAAAEVLADGAARVSPMSRGGDDGSVAWFVVERMGQARWAAIDGPVDIVHELVVLYFDEPRRLLFIHSSTNPDSLDTIATAVVGAGHELLKEEVTFRVLHDIGQPVPTNIGLLDITSIFRRFSMHTGADVLEGFEEVEGRDKTQTHIAVRGFADGDKVAVSAARSGRFWSPRTAASLKQWVDWCQVQGAKLTDSSIKLADILSSFVIPEVVTERPPYVLLAVDWPTVLYTGLSSIPTVDYDGTEVSLLDCDLEPIGNDVVGPFRFALVSSHWSVEYRADVDTNGRWHFAAADRDVVAASNRLEPVPFAPWMANHPPSFLLAGDRMVDDHGRLLQLRRDLPPFPRDQLEVISWTGVDIRRESQGAGKDTTSIQAHMIEWLIGTGTCDVVLDDDGSGEVADIVGLRATDRELQVHLIHCKFSSEDEAGGRLKDLYEVAGQAQRSARWRQNTDAMLARLARRAGNRLAAGRLPFEVGDEADLIRLQELAPQLRPKFTVYIAQPGISGSAVTADQLQLLAGASSYLKNVANARLRVIINE